MANLKSSQAEDNDCGIYRPDDFAVTRGHVVTWDGQSLGNAHSWVYGVTSWNVS